MSENQISPDTKKVYYLDTSFIFNVASNFYNKEKKVVANTQEVFGLLYQYKIGKCFISNITINELFNVVEKQGYRAFIDSKIIRDINISEKDWKQLHNSEKEKYRQEKDRLLGFDFYDIKTWRKDEYKTDYKIYVYNEFENIMDSFSVLELSIISNSVENLSLYYERFKTNKKIYTKLDSNDLNHFLVCKENNIDCIITCDSDFTQIPQSELEVIHIHKDFNYYKSTK